MKKTNNNYVVKYRRYRSGETDYHARLRLLKSRKVRFVVRKSLTGVTVQFVEYSAEGDKVLAHVTSSMLEKYGWKANKGNLPAAYLSGFLAGSLVKSKIKNTVVPDIGRNVSSKGSRIYAAIKGAIDAGLDLHAKDEILPDESRLNGSHISNYAAALKSKDSKAYEKLFSKYIKNKVKPEDITKMFEETKKKISAIKSD